MGQVPVSLSWARILRPVPLSPPVRLIAVNANPTCWPEVGVRTLTVPRDDRVETARSWQRNRGACGKMLRRLTPRHVRTAIPISTWDVTWGKC